MGKILYEIPSFLTNGELLTGDAKATYVTHQESIALVPSAIRLSQLGNFEIQFNSDITKFGENGGLMIALIFTAVVLVSCGCVIYCCFCGKSKEDKNDKESAVQNEGGALSMINEKGETSTSFGSISSTYKKGCCCCENENLDKPILGKINKGGYNRNNIYSSFD